jgi:hypothetical protein
MALREAGRVADRYRDGRIRRPLGDVPHRGADRGYTGDGGLQQSPVGPVSWRDEITIRSAAST